MPETKLAILLSGSGTTLQNIADTIARGDLHARISLVIASNSTCFGIQRAKNLRLPVEIFTRKTSASLEDFSARITAALQAHHVDLVCMAGFLSLWTIPHALQNRVLNIHPALLSLQDPAGHPRFGGLGMHGLHVHQAVLAAGEKTSGCTVHFADNSYDTGPIILERTCPVLPIDTPESLAARVFTQECIAYPQAIRTIAAQLAAQPPSATTSGTHHDPG